MSRPGSTPFLTRVRDFAGTREGRITAVVLGLIVAFGGGWAIGHGSGDSTVSISATPTSPPIQTEEPTVTGTASTPEETASTPGQTTSTDGSGPATDSPTSTDSAPVSSAGSGVSPVTIPGGTVPRAPIPSFTCPAATTRVSTADQLSGALENAAPGTVIQLADGVYQGNFTAARSGTAARPIYLCGSRNAILQSDGPKGGYVLHFDGASYWRAVGFTVRNGQKGVMVDAGNHLALQGLLVEEIGDEAVHLRKNSSDNVVRGLTIRSTGHRRDKFGEGVYIGTAQSNWPQITGGAPDHSDRNFVLGNVIYQTTAEAVDIKEGTSKGVVAGNTFDGSQLTGADSWVDVKGNGWLIAGNHGRVTPKDGFQTHVVVQGWGDANRFIGNVADLSGAGGVGYYLHEQLSNQVSCTNKVTGGQLSNKPCQG